MTETTPATTSRPPLWRDVRVLRVAGQILFLIGVVFVLREIFLNLRFGLARQGVSLDWDFLRERAGFGLADRAIAYGPNSTFLRALQVGLTNTLRVAGLGIVLASLLGLVIGVARLSPNWLIRSAARVYVEIFRNTPLLVQIIFWYVAVFLELPSIDDARSLGGILFSNTGTAVPWLRGEPGSQTLFLVVLLGLVAAWGVARWRRARFDRTGQPAHAFLWWLGSFLAIAVVGFLATGTPLRANMPRVDVFHYAGGVQFSTEFTGLLVALVIYTSAFIGEIVRGSILAVEKGQKEAAAALGLQPGQQLRLVVLPQAMRIAIPAINSQYQNLIKNSSLAVVIGFADIVFVARTIANQAGRATNVLLLVVAAYLTLTLTTSLLMNLFNRAVALRGARR